jgi:TatD DNase family protein
MAAHWDTHCHLQDPRCSARVPDVLARARAAGVVRLVCCATREADWDRVLDLARDHPAVLPMLGLHPWFLEEAAAGWEARLGARLEAARAGIGECGLDFSPGRPDRRVQEAAFEAHLAAERDLPLSIHCVRAWAALLALLRRTGVPPAGAVVHAYSGSAETAAELQALGLHLSFAPFCLRPGARKAPLALAAVAADRLLFETDMPWGPEGTFDPGQVPMLVEAAAMLRGADPEALGAQAGRNALRVFGRLAA